MCLALSTRAGGRHVLPRFVWEMVDSKRYFVGLFVSGPRNNLALLVGANFCSAKITENPSKE